MKNTWDGKKIQVKKKEQFSNSYFKYSLQIWFGSSWI